NLGRVQSVLCDSGYTGKPFEQGVQEIVGEHVTVQIAKRSELHTFKVMPKRWIVERSFAWLDKNRRLWKNCERLLNTSLQFVHLAFLALLLRRS
ncbi:MULTISPECIES: transposase, partial [Comamonas]